MHSRRLAMTLGLLLAGTDALAQTGARASAAPATPPPSPNAPARAPSPPVRTPAPPVTAPPRASARPSHGNPAEPDLVQAASQVLQGVLQGGTAPREEPPARRGNELPTELLRSAGLDPARLPGALGPMLRADPARADRLSPAQLRQLARLARRNATLRQLGAVADSFLRAERTETPGAEPSHPVLSGNELERVLSRAVGGATPDSLGRLVSSLLAP